MLVPTPLRHAPGWLGAFEAVIARFAAGPAPGRATLTRSGTPLPEIRDLLARNRG